jgi:molybdate transport system regulatory protein
MNLGAKLYLFSEANPGIFGAGKWLLLDTIRKEGSLQKAAAGLNRGYRKAWGDLQAAQEGFARPLVTKTRGGAGGGQTELTEFGLQLLSAWDKVHAEMTKQAEKSFQKHILPLLSSAPNAQKTRRLSKSKSKTPGNR